MTSGKLLFRQFDLGDIKHFDQLELEVSLSDVEEEASFSEVEEEDFSRRRKIINIPECPFAWQCGNNNNDSAGKHVNLIKMKYNRRLRTIRCPRSRQRVEREDGSYLTCTMGLMVQASTMSV